MLLLFSREYTSGDLAGTLPSFSMEMDGGPILAGDLTGQFPSFTFSGTLSIADPEPLEILLPALTGSFYAGSFVADTLPSLEMQLTGHPGRVGDFIGTLPGFSLEAFTAGYLDIDLPMFTQAMTATATVIANLEALLPKLNFNGVISLASDGDLSGTLPRMSMSASGIVGAICDITASFPEFTLEGTITSGPVGDFELTLPQFQSNISGIRTGENELDGTFPAIKMTISSGSITSGVLRHQKERIR